MTTPWALRMLATVRAYAGIQIEHGSPVAKFESHEKGIHVFPRGMAAHTIFLCGLGTTMTPPLMTPRRRQNWPLVAAVFVLLALCTFVATTKTIKTTGATSHRHGASAVKDACPPSSLRIVILYGTRPEAIKMAPIIHQFANASSWACPLVVSTGQHREMLRTLEPYLGIAPDVDMGLMKRAQRPEHVLLAIMSRLDDMFRVFEPHVVIVQGDTTSAMAAAMAAFHAGVHVAHVEAGLRTGDMGAPFPEEFNRRVISMVASLNFAPTVLAAAVLQGEGVQADHLFMTGNTVVDALHSALASPPDDVVTAGGVRLARLDVGEARRVVGGATRHTNRGTARRRESGASHRDYLLVDTTAQLRQAGRHVVLVTTHRRENAKSGAMGDLAKAVARVASSQPGTLFVVPLHLSPSVRGRVVPHLIGCDNVWLVEPPDYPVFVQLLTRVTLILTDSGGLQEEALSLNIPVLIARRSTERMEGVEAGGALLVGDDAVMVEAALRRMLTSADDYARHTQATNPYGDGNASHNIARIVRESVDWLVSKPSHAVLRYIVNSVKSDVLL